jgi:hypothetical protein
LNSQELAIYQILLQTPIQVIWQFTRFSWQFSEHSGKLPDLQLRGFGNSRDLAIHQILLYLHICDGRCVFFPNTLPQKLPDCQKLAYFFPCCCLRLRHGHDRKVRVTGCLSRRKNTNGTGQRRPDGHAGRGEKSPRSGPYRPARLP